MREVGYIWRGVGGVVGVVRVGKWRLGAGSRRAGTGLLDAPNELRNHIRHDIICKYCNRNMLARFSQYLSLFYVHPEKQLRCSQ